MYFWLLSFLGFELLFIFSFTLTLQEMENKHLISHLGQLPDVQLCNHQMIYDNQTHQDHASYKWQQKFDHEPKYQFTGNPFPVTTPYQQYYPILSGTNDYANTMQADYFYIDDHPENSQLIFTSSGLAIPRVNHNLFAYPQKQRPYYSGIGRSSL